MIHSGQFEGWTNDYDDGMPDCGPLNGMDLYKKETDKPTGKKKYVVRTDLKTIVEYGVFYSPFWNTNCMSLYLTVLGSPI